MGNFGLKKVVENEINDVLNESTDKAIHGFFLCDINHFASINSRYGREKAEKILDEVDFFIRNFFRGTDIEGRVRGDEYEVLIREPKSIADIELICEKFLSVIAEKKFSDVSISMTVGVSIYPFHGTNYRQLKEKAYMALVRSKNSKTASYRIYDAAITKAKYSDFRINKEFGEIDFRTLAVEDWDKFFIDVSARFLHDDTNVFAAMNSILEILCLYYGFGRAFVVTSDVDDESSNISEFYLPGVPQIESELVTPLRKDLVARLIDEKGNHALVTPNDVNDAEIKAYMEDFGCSQIMYFAHSLADRMTCAVVFENSADKENVKVDDIDRLADQILVVWSYIYLAFQTLDTKEIMSKVKMFEAMEADVYIINAQNYFVEFMNSHALRRSKGLLEKKCYELLHNADSPCENCPLKDVESGKSIPNTRMECFNCSSCSWAIHLYSPLDGAGDKNRILLESVDIDMINTMMK